MHVSFIGMSNIGKTHWAQVLADRFGFEAVDCDQLIEAKLKPELEGEKLSGIDGVARWMGQPYEPNYAEASDRYLALEGAVMAEISDKLTRAQSRPLAIATTGSIVHLPADVLKRLGAQTRLVYLEASMAHSDEMLERYLAKPKPVVWGDFFKIRAGESFEAALHRCYPDLLAAREALYRSSGAQVVPFEQHYRQGDGWLRSLLTSGDVIGAA